MKNCGTSVRVFCLAALALVVCATQAQAAGTFILDLSATNAVVPWNQARLEEVGTRSTGTGTFDPFLRLQGEGKPPILAGYNTDGTLEFNAKDPWTSALSLSAVPIVAKGGTDYREFLLDINQDKTGDGRLYSLDALEIYETDDRYLTGYGAAAPHFGGSADLVWELDDPAYLAGLGLDDAWVLLDYSNNTGSGSGDMALYIPDSLFSGLDYVVLYSHFGNVWPNTASFEEWGVGENSGTPSVPAPGALLLGAIGAGLVGRLRQRSIL